MIIIIIYVVMSLNLMCV